MENKTAYVSTCPGDLDIAQEFLSQRGYSIANAPIVARDADWPLFMSRHFSKLPECECIYLFSGWQSSPRARIEHALSNELGLDVIFQDPCITGDKIIEAVCNNFKLHPQKLQRNNHRTTTHISMARQLTDYLIRLHLKLSLEEVAYYTSGSHSTVLHSIKQVNNYLQTKDIIFIPLYQAVCEDLLRQPAASKTRVHTHAPSS